MLNDNGLDNCPFCGGKPKLFVQRRSARVVCSSCHARITRTHAYSGELAPMHAVANAWNRRMVARIVTAEVTA